jgi:hypothetical protein
MRRLFVIPCAIALTVSSAALADDAAAVKKEILAGYTKRMEALKKRDIKGFIAFNADDYKGTSQGRTVTKAEVEADMKGYIADTNTINSYSYDVQNLKVNGKNATGKATFALDATVKDSQGMFGAKGKTHRLKFKQNFDTTYIKIGGDWKLSKEMELNPPKVTIDGKPFNPMAPAGGTQKPSK